MSDVEADPGEAVGEPRAVPPAQGSRTQRWRWWWLAAAAIVAVAVAAVVLIQGSWAAAHQPITWGCCEADPAGVGIRAVNTFGGYREDFYVPPQRGTFIFSATIMNNGSRSVRIEKATIGQLYGELRLVGPVRYAKRILLRPTAELRRFPVLHEVTLGPGQQLFLAMSLRTWPCAQTSGWDVDPSFYLTERSLLFAHTVAVPWSMDGGVLIMRPSGARGQPGTFCAAKQGG